MVEIEREEGKVLVGGLSHGDVGERI